MHEYTLRYRVQHANGTMGTVDITVMALNEIKAMILGDRELEDNHDLVGWSEPPQVLTIA
jgi:hypothetical protein